MGGVNKHTYHNHAVVVVKNMAGSETSWDAIFSFCEAVLLEKKVAKRVRKVFAASSAGDRVARGQHTFAAFLSNRPEGVQLGEADHLHTWPENARAGCSCALL